MSARAVVPVALALGLAACRAADRGAEGHATTTSAEASDPHAQHRGHGGDDAGHPAGYAAFTLDPQRARAIGLATAPVEERAFVRQLRATGLVAVDETRTSHVHAKVRGWVDGISVAYVGQRIARGQTLCAIYSQEVYAAELEYVSLLARAGTPPTAAGGELADRERRAHGELVAAARRRLSLWDVPRAEIERLEATREARRTFPLLAPRAGTVLQKQVVDGMFVDPSAELYTIADLSRVWVLADLYETDAAAVRVGHPARLEIQGLADPIDAKVAFVPPTIDEPTRTLEVRFELENGKRALRPGAFATVTMDIALGRGLAVPEEAVIRTGTRAIAFVVHDGKHVVPREVRLGPKVGDHFRVEAGLAAGELVATGAQFLLDSESRLRASGGSGAGHGGH